MAEYLAPGVFVEEVSFRSKSIEGVGTSVAGIVGPTRYGPVRGMPEVVTSFGEFSRVYGDVRELVFGDDPQPNYTAIAARAFFDNGGKQLFVARVAAGGGAAPAAASISADNDDDDTPLPVLTFRARFLGAMGDFTLEIVWRDAEQTEFDLLVRNGGPDGPVIRIHDEISTDPASENSLAEKLPPTPAKRNDFLTNPVSCEFGAGADSAVTVRDALLALCDDAAQNPTEPSVDGPRFLIALTGGTDGTAPPDNTAYQGVADEVNGSSGLAAF
ncbi:MAG: hypothetical protein J5F18_09835, partial [Halomonas sp. BM-2019]